MDSVTVYMLPFLGNVLLHPVSSGWFAGVGMFTLAFLGFCMQFWWLGRAKRRWVRSVPFAVCLLFDLYGELRWNGIVHFKGDGAGFLPIERFVGFAFGFVAFALLSGVVIGFLCRACVKRCFNHKRRIVE